MHFQAEAVVECARSSATALAQQKEIVTPDVALAILQRLGRLRTPEAAAKLQVRILSYRRRQSGLCMLSEACTASWPFAMLGVLPVTWI